MSKLFALVDCNNFFASCERVFNPALVDKPVVVLSNNDGCVIARSNEAKALGIPMGAPYFQWKDLMVKNKVNVFSTNFTLYGDMSQRVMTTIATLAPEMEIYSIDECFIDLTKVRDPEKLARQIRARVKKWTGIPVSIGIAETKTLAKVANRIAKKNLKHGGVYKIKDETDRTQILFSFPVGDVWGIGRRNEEKLKNVGIDTVAKLLLKPDSWIKKNLTISGLRLANELRGISCLQLETEPDAQKSLACTRSFGKVIETKDQLEQALITYATMAGKKLRERNLFVSYFQIFIRTSHFAKGDARFANSIGMSLPQSTNDTFALAKYASQMLDKIYRPGYRYGKAGVICSDLTSNAMCQGNFFQNNNSEKCKNLMEAMDKINERYGSETVFLAGSGIKKLWGMNQKKRSSSFTTNWDGLVTVKS